MRFVGAHNKRKAVPFAKVLDGLHAKADAITAAQRRSEPLPVALPLLLLTSRVAPNTVRRDLLLPVALVTVRWGDTSDGRHRKDLLNLILKVGNRARKASVDAVDVVVDHGRKGQAVEHTVAFFPHFFSNRSAESRLHAP